MTSAGASSALDRRTLLATVAIAVLLGLFAMNDVPVGVFQDDGHYLILARALARGEGYRYFNLPGAPPATHFPPGYPLLLMPLWWVSPRFPANVALLKLLNVALLPLAALAVRALARRVSGLSVAAASAVAVASVATVPVLFLTGLIFSETAFIGAMCGALMTAERLAGSAGATRRAALGVGVAVGALALLRTVGVALLPAVLAVLLWRRRWRDAALVFAGALALLLPWQWWTAVHAHDVPTAIAGAYGAYGPWLAAAYRAGGPGFAWDVLRENAHGFLMPLTLFGLMPASPWMQGAAVAALAVLAGAGAWHLRRRAPVTLCFFIPYGALLLVWPFVPDRFLWPLWPVVLVLLVVGTSRLGWGDDPPSRRRSATRVVVRVAAAALGALFVVWHARTWPTRSWEGIARENARVGMAAAAVAAGLPGDGLIASDQDAMVHLYAGRRAVPLLTLTAEERVHERTDADMAAQLDGVLDAYHPRWVVVVQRPSMRAAQQLVQRGRLKLMGAAPSGVLVYDVVR